MAAAFLVSCGGGSMAPGAASEPEAPFRSFAASAQSAAAADATPPVLDAASLAEIQTRSRERAVAVLAQTDLANRPNAFTMPPMYFALTQIVGLAARGDTLAALNREAPPVSSPAAQAGLVRGLWRQMSAGAETPFKTAFMSGARLEAQPGTWRRFDFTTLSAQDLAATPQQRLQVADHLDFAAAWPQATSFRASWRTVSGSWNVPMVRVTGPLLALGGSGYEAQGLALPAGGGWLIRITPAAPMADWTAADLDKALAAVARAALGRSTSDATTGELLLPAVPATVVGMADRPGMALAMDRVHADLRGLDGGGTYLEAPEGGGSFFIGEKALSYDGYQAARFIFSPLNIYGGGSAGYEATGPNYGLPPCLEAEVELRPFYMAHIQSNGNLAMLARLSWFGGERCQ